MRDTFKPTYECGYCNKIYKIESAYNKHTQMCKLFMKSKNNKQPENNEHIPSNSELYSIIQILVNKCSALEKKVESLQGSLHKNNRKFDILEWLNNQNIKNVCSFNEWINSIIITINDMELVFENGFIKGIQLIIENILPLSNNTRINPIKAYTQKDNILYIFNGQSWEIMTAEVFELFVYKITKGLLSQFKCWQDKNANRRDDNFTKKYSENVKKILGGSLSREQQVNKIRVLLYNHLKIKITFDELII
jgi:hypothetical protein